MLLPNILMSIAQLLPNLRCGTQAVTTACKKYGGFYLGSIGGPAAILAQNCIKKVGEEPRGEGVA